MRAEPEIARIIRPIPSPPRLDLWPVALRHALKLRGALVPCGPGMRGVGWPDTPAVRLATLAPWLKNGAAASHLTAAWVWGAARAPGSRIELSVGEGRRPPPRFPGEARWYELRYEALDRVALGGLLVTSPERTVFDLLHRSGEFGTVETVACRLLLRRAGDASARVGQLLKIGHRRRAPLARARFERLGA